MNNTNTNEVLNALDTIRNKTTYAVYIPSLQREHMFKEISTSQEKRLVKSIIDNPVFGTQLIYALREMIKENATDGLNVDTLTVFDKLSICLTLRSKCIGSIFTHVDSKTKKETEVNIDTLLGQIRDVELPVAGSFKNDDISITCEVPTIKEEYDLEVAVGRKLKNFDNVTPDNASGMLESAYIGELVKYIKTITLTMNDELREIQMQGLDFKTRLSFVERLGVTLTSSVLGYIKDYNEIINTVMTDSLSGVMVEVSSDFFTE